MIPGFHWPSTGLAVVASGLVVGLIAIPSSCGAKPAGTMERLQQSVWIEGPGYEVTYGRTYDWCAQRCVEATQCIMIEYYRPESKCNLYSAVRPRRPGGSSFVAIKKAPGATAPTGLAEATTPATGSAPAASLPKLISPPVLVRESNRMGLGIGR